MGQESLDAKAANTVRLYKGQLQRAQRDYEIAERAMVEARTELGAAERAYEAATRVFQAAAADRSDEIGFDRLSAVTKRWLWVLLAHPHAGFAEMADAATAIRWDLAPEALRQRASVLAKSGVLDRVGQGVYRVSERARSLFEDAAARIDQRVSSSPEPKSPEDECPATEPSFGSAKRDSNYGPDSREGNAPINSDMKLRRPDDDYIDDYDPDPAF